MRRFSQVAGFAGLAAVITVLSCTDLSTTVQDGVNTIGLSSDLTTLQVGDTVRVAALAANLAGVSLSNVDFVWNSSNTSVATVSETGLVTAVSPGTSDISATADNKTASVTVTVVTAATNTLAFATQPSASVQSGVAFIKPASVQVRLGTAPISQSGVTVTANISSGGGTLGGAVTATTNAVGIATFTDLTISGLIGPRILEFSAPGFGTLTSASISVIPGPPASIAIVTQPSAAVESDAVFPTQPAVQLFDAATNLITQSGLGVSVALTSGTTGTLNGTKTASTNSSGVAAFTDLSINGIGDFTLDLSATGTTPVTSSVITVAVPPKTSLAFGQLPSASAQNGVVLPQQPRVQLRQGISPYAEAGVIVTAEIASGGGTLGGTATATTDATGLARFTNLSLSGTLGPRTLTFSAPGYGTLTSGNITLNAGPVAALVIKTQPATSATTGVAFAPQPSVQLQDSSGNDVSKSGVAVTASLASGTGTLNGSKTVTTNASGLATFSGLSLSAAGIFEISMVTANAKPVIADPMVVTNPPLVTTQAVATVNASRNVALTAVTPVTASGGLAPYAFGVAPALPAGLSMSATTGRITGTPTVALASTTFTVTVTDAAGATSSNTFALSVVIPPLVTTQAVASITTNRNVAMTAKTPVTASGGTTPYTFDVSPALPSGLSMNTATGQITGTPTVALASTTFTVTVTDAAAVTSSKTFTLSVTVPALATTLAVSSMNTAPNVAFTPTTPVTASGGTTPYAFAVSPSLPSGVSMSTTTGQVTGTPTATFPATSFAVTVTDGAGATSSKSFTLSVTTPPAAGTPTMYFNSAEPGCDGSDPNILFCDDFESGFWYTADCDHGGNTATQKGWCGTIYANPIKPAGAASCGGMGAANTNCAANGGLHDGSQGGVNMADHQFNGGPVTELWARWYYRTDAGYKWGAEKHTNFTKAAGDITWFNVHFNCGTGSADPDAVPFIQIIHGSSSGCYRPNQGVDFRLDSGKWYYFEVHVRLNSSGTVSDGLVDMWINDCGTTGVCTGTPTLRTHLTNVGFDRNQSGCQTSPCKIETLWFENWANPGSTGTGYLDQIKVSKAGPIGFVPP
jgi:hypothetical protein